MSKSSLPTISRVSELLSSDPLTGVLTWKVSRGRMAAGSVAGAIGNGYLHVSIDGKNIGAHRIVWALANGRWPDNFIDHINGERRDNRLCNLRDVTVQVNTQNRTKAASHNSTGVLGVGYHKRAKKFYSSIKASDGAHHLGYFDTAEQASEAYQKAKKLLHSGNGASEHFNRKAKTTCLEEMQARMAA